MCTLVVFPNKPSFVSLFLCKLLRICFLALLWFYSCISCFPLTNSDGFSLISCLEFKIENWDFHLGGLALCWTHFFIFPGLRRVLARATFDLFSSSFWTRIFRFLILLKSNYQYYWLFQVATQALEFTIVVRLYYLPHHLPRLSHCLCHYLKSFLMISFPLQLAYQSRRTLQNYLYFPHFLFLKSFSLRTIIPFVLLLFLS